jgi:DNA repair exonuclease SbcCD ATPase subunit
LLDDLAEDFGFTEAGANLKAAREQTRHMVRDGHAGTCEYVEVNRRETAIAFVVDAFNGKVDSILSRTKSDNVGKLQQEIRDAFTLVNRLGSAFRDARITAPYLQARLDESRWAAVALELKNKEKEEQRHLKEQLREEEKARREYERAIRDAEREEEALRKAMAKVQREVEQASEAQRAKYEAQLAELGVKLKEAEEKNQRAISMAQQTKRGHVYVISNLGSFGEDVFKIGLTRRLEPLDRVRELGDASVPFEFDVHALIKSDDAPALEHALHRHFMVSQMNKVNPRKEFFRVKLSAIREEIEKLGVQASWTMKAAAAHYRESLAIDKAIKENPASFTAWTNKQLVLDATIPEEGEMTAGSIPSNEIALDS